MIERGQHESVLSIERCRAAELVNESVPEIVQRTTGVSYHAGNGGGIGVGGFAVQGKVDGVEHADDADASCVGGEEDRTAGVVDAGEISGEEHRQQSRDDEHPAGRVGHHCPQGSATDIAAGWSADVECGANERSNGDDSREGSGDYRRTASRDARSGDFCSRRGGTATRIIGLETALPGDEDEERD